MHVHAAPSDQRPHPLYAWQIDAALQDPDGRVQETLLPLAPTNGRLLDAPVTLLECQRSRTYHQALVFVCRPLPKAPLFKVWPVDLHTTSPTSGATQARRISLHAADNTSLTLAHFRFH